ncbi:nucleoside-diphosphate-sugar epimerase [Pyrenophora seminiperda CCB06]|uniref:Nucleoside-diphosphate-sugar epimerase n=1 Tax=Pyrenophora seminiperda CCB06 TaxID=1302712 RepID=A0A3M7MHB3_9PLEO|nr:nucleoside-diphosphate-sugar epimerase [Pyrenophora seminiperda CCB06]
MPVEASFSTSRLPYTTAAAAMHLILTGATGLCGASVLHNMLGQESISRISILSRRPVKMAEGHEKVKVILHKDFLKYDQALLDELNDAHGCVWALGVSQNDVNKEKYFEITHDYPLAAARAFSTLHPESPFTFVYVSGEGATQTPGPFTFLYGRVKGQIESALLDFGKQNTMFKVFNVRPAGVDEGQHPEIHPFIPKQPFFKKALLVPMRPLFQSFLTPTREMGKIMTELAMSKGEPLEGKDVSMGGRTVPNVAIRRLAGL